MSLECEASLINSKEFAGKENSEVANKKSKLQEKSKGLLYWMCISFSDLARSPFIA
jgi:hypothetical protein